MEKATENFRRNILNGVIRFMRLKSCYERRGLLSRSMMDVHYQLLNNVQQNSCISVIKRISQENEAAETSMAQTITNHTIFSGHVL